MVPPESNRAQKNWIACGRHSVIVGFSDARVAVNTRQQVKFSAIRAGGSAHGANIKNGAAVEGSAAVADFVRGVPMLGLRSSYVSNAPIPTRKGWANPD